MCVAQLLCSLALVSTPRHTRSLHSCHPGACTKKQKRILATVLPHIVDVLQNPRLHGGNPTIASMAAVRALLPRVKGECPSFTTLITQSHSSHRSMFPNSRKWRISHRRHHLRSSTLLALLNVHTVIHMLTIMVNTYMPTHRRMCIHGWSKWSRLCSPLLRPLLDRGIKLRTCCCRGGKPSHPISTKR